MWPQTEDHKARAAVIAAPRTRAIRRLLHGTLDVSAEQRAQQIRKGGTETVRVLGVEPEVDVHVPVAPYASSVPASEALGQLQYR
eukprot:1786284-Rhodomonas_salina.4